jgi:hypothetical protein
VGAHQSLFLRWIGDCMPRLSSSIWSSSCPLASWQEARSTEPRLIDESAVVCWTMFRVSIRPSILTLTTVTIRCPHSRSSDESILEAGPENRCPNRFSRCYTDLMHIGRAFTECEDSTAETPTGAQPFRGVGDKYLAFGQRN